MTDGELFVSRLPMKTDFHDRSKRRSYDLTRSVAMRIIDDPSLVKRGRDYMEHRMRRDPRQSRYYDVWDELLRHDVRHVVRQMLEDTPRGDLLRDTQPVFFIMSPDERARLGRPEHPEPQYSSHP